MVHKKAICLQPQPSIFVLCRKSYIVRHNIFDEQLPCLSIEENLDTAIYYF